MRLIVRHLGSVNDGHGHRFAVENGDTGKQGPEVILPPPESIQVEDRPNSNLRQDIAWYLEEFLEYPFPPKTETAERVFTALTNWGAACFAKLFTSNALLWYAKARDAGLESLTLCIASDTPAVLARAWAVLRDGDGGLFLAHQASIERQLGGKLPDPPPLPDNLPQDALNILLIIARPYGERDVGFHAVSRPLVELARQDARVRIEILRPPTFDALRERLEARPGFYHLVHFDGHGGYGAATPQGAPFVFDAKAQGKLFFEDAHGKEAPVKAEQLTNLLARHRIPLVVLNACRSAAIDEDAADPFAAVATALLRSGIRGVVAMGYNLFVGGAQQFVPAFYRRLFATGEIGEATRAGREAMYTHPERDCVRGSYPLQDWLLPVLYQQQAPKLPFVSQTVREKRPDAVSLPEDAKTLGDLGFIGRERAFLALERALRNQPQGAILIHGMAGIGKTTLARGLLQWLADTGGLHQSPLWLGFEDIRSAEYVINQLLTPFFGIDATAQPMAQKLPALVKALREMPLLIVWDNFESAAGIPGTAVTPLLSDADRALLKQLITGIDGGKSRILITSRAPERWLDPMHCFRLPLGGLQGEERWAYCNAITRRLGLTLDREDPDFLKLMDRLDGHPLAMRLLLLRLQERSAGQLLEELEGESQGSAGGASSQVAEAALALYSKTLPAEFAQVLQLIGLHRRYVVCSDLEQMAKIAGLDLPRACIDACFASLEAGGVLQSLRGGVYGLHPALPGFLAAHYYPAVAECRRGFVTFMAALADHLAPKPLHEQQGPFHIHGENLHQARVLAPESGVEDASSSLLQCVADYAKNNRDWNEAGRLLQELLSYHKERGEGRKEAAVYHQLGMLAEEQRRWQEATEWYERSLAIKERLGDMLGAAGTSHQLGVVAQKQWQLGEAAGWYQKSLAISEQLGDKRVVATTRYQLGIIAEKQQQWLKAKNWFIESLASFEQLGDMEQLAGVYRQLGTLAKNQQQWQEAKGWYQKSLTISEKIGIKKEHLAGIYHQLGTLAQEQQQWQEAEDWYQKSLAIEEQIGNEHGAAQTCYQLGTLAALQGACLESTEWLIKALRVFRNARDGNLSNITLNGLVISLALADPASRECMLDLWDQSGLGEEVVSRGELLRFAEEMRQRMEKETPST